MKLMAWKIFAPRQVWLSKEPTHDKIQDKIHGKIQDKNPSFRGTPAHPRTDDACRGEAAAQASQPSPRHCRTRGRSAGLERGLHERPRPKRMQGTHVGLWQSGRGLPPSRGVLTLARYRLK